MRNFKKFLALVLAMMMVVGGMVTVSAAEETVAAEYDYTAAAEALADLGIVKGTSDDVIDFALEDKVVRYQMALLVARIMTGEVDDTYWNKVVENTTPFDDVTKYYGAIAYVADNEIVEGKGWIPGVGDNCFDPEGAITYEQALTMAVRALGYKQLVYPTGFVNTAKELGLTDGLEELAGDTQLTRGQMFQIIYNLFFTAGKDGKDFATKAFGLETKSYVVVATENQALVGAKRVYRVDDYSTQTAWSKYVALAPINKDGSYDLDAIIHLTEGELGMEFKESEYRLGYSYTVLSFDGFKTAYAATANDTKTFQNFGDVKDPEIAAGTKYHGQADNLILLDGITYKLVKSYTDLNNKDSYANRQPELIMHSMFKGDALVEVSSLYYDLAGNVINPANGEILIMYNNINGVYYVQDANGFFRVATDADFVAAATKTSQQTAQYGIETNIANLINDIAFCEITLFDDNNDGAWDRGLYIPYSIGKYTTTTPTSNVTFNVTKSAKDKSTYASINGYAIGATVEVSNGKWEATTYVAQNDITFIGADRPANNQYVIYYYNPQGRVFNTLEKASVKTAKVTAVNQGTYSYDGKINNALDTKGAYYWSNATVTLEGEAAPLVMGYRDYVSYKQIGLDDIETDLLYIDAQIARYGYDQVVYDALLNNSFMSLEYVVLADRLVYAEKKDNRTIAGQWMVFDYGEETVNPNTGATGFTTYGYEGDIIGVDADGNILVNAYVQGKKEQIVAAIGSINGFDTFGELVADYAALNFGFSGIGILGNEQYETMQKIVIRRFFDTLAKDLGAGSRQLVYTVTGVEDGVYSIYTDINIYWGKDGNPYRQPKALFTPGANNVDVYVLNGYMSASFGSPYGVIKFNENSKIVVVGKDGIRTASGIPEDNATIAWKTTGTPIYALGADIIVLINPNANCDTIYTGKFDDQYSSEGYTYYWVVGDNATGELVGETTATVTWDANGVGTYTYKNLYNLNKNALQTKTIVGGLPEYRADQFGQLVLNTKPLGAIYAEKGGKWTLVNTLTTATVTGNVVSQVKYAPDAYNDLLNVLYYADANSAYAPIFSTYGKCIGDKASAANGFHWMFKDPAGNTKEIFDDKLGGLLVVQLKVNFNNEGILTSIVAPAASANARAYGKDGIVYYNHVQGTSFVGTYVHPHTGKTLAELKAAAVATIDALTPADADALAAAKIAINDAKTAAAITAAVDTYKAVVNGKVDTLANAKTAAIEKIEAAAAGYAADLIVVGDKTVADRVAEYAAEINACTSVEDDYIKNIDTHVAYLANQLAAAAAADAAAKNTIVVDGKTATMMGGATKISEAFGSTVTKMFKAEIFKKVDGQYTSVAATASYSAFGGQEGTIALPDGYRLTVKLADGNLSITPFQTVTDDADFEYTTNLFEVAGEYLVRVTVKPLAGGETVKIDFPVVIAE